MIPVYIKTSDFSEPTSRLYYLVAANGAFLVSKTNLFTAVTKAEAVSGLEEQEASISLRFPRIPRKILEQIYGFFLAVYEKWGGEAIVFLYYDQEGHSFHVAVPPQTVFRYRSYSGKWKAERRVTYGYLPRPHGLVKLGDAHSHADLPAFFSCQDDKDDNRESGLRITIGDLDRSRPAVSASFVTGGTRFILKPEGIMEDFSIACPPPHEWLEQVTCEDEAETFRSHSGGRDEKKSDLRECAEKQN